MLNSKQIIKQINPQQIKKYYKFLANNFNIYLMLYFVNINIICMHNNVQANL